MKIAKDDFEVESHEVWIENESRYELTLSIDKGRDRIVLDADEISMLRELLDSI